MSTRETVQRYTRRPYREPVGRGGDPADELLRLACLTYGRDDLARHRGARELLAIHPELATRNIYTAAAVGDIRTAATLLAAAPALANADGGPFRWPPLLYLAFSRIDSSAAGHSTLEVARLLLAHGADPDAGYLWDGQPSPFTALTGAFGGGEDAVNQPGHQYGNELARLLLDAGADPNDSQALYNRHFRPADDHLELLLEYGLGRGEGGPWHARLAPEHPAPQQLVADELVRAAVRNLPDRVRLLLRHDVPPDAVCTAGHPAAVGRTAYALAFLLGNTEVAELLAAGGARPPAFGPAETVVAACMRGDRETVDRLRVEDPSLPAQVVTGLPELIIQAAELNRPAAVRLLVDLGVDVNTRLRITPLHAAAYEGNLELVRLLVELGADPAIVDTEFDSTPLGWAEHNHRHEVAAYLAGCGRA